MMTILSIATQLDSIAKRDSLNAIQAELASVMEKLATTPTIDLLKELIDNTIRFGLKLLAAFLIYIVGAWVIKKVKHILARSFEKRGTDAGVASFIQSIASIALTIILIIITVGTLGIDTSSIAALLTGGGLAIGLALNGTVQNFAGGLMILVFKPFKAGDFIEMQGFAGTVTEINITSTKLTTTDNRVIIVPNGKLSSEVINNYSSRQMRRLEINIDVEYGSSADLTKDVLFEIIKADSRILSIDGGAPADPFVALSALKDSSVEFIMRVWVKSEDYWNVKFSLNEEIYKKLPENGINFPFPQLDVNIKNN
jgi:small conductance mechanosensitive channel